MEKTNKFYFYFFRSFSLFFFRGYDNIEFHFCNDCSEKINFIYENQNFIIDSFKKTFEFQYRQFYRHWPSNQKIKILNFFQHIVYNFNYFSDITERKKYEIDYKIKRSSLSTYLSYKIQI
jgi:hypothetical protein